MIQYNTISGYPIWDNHLLYEDLPYLEHNARFDIEGEAVTFEVCGAQRR